jgi:rhomboid protease GluP
MYGLLIGGVMLTPVARNMRLIIVYLVSGLGGSLLSVTVHPDIVVVGASGAIFGFFGALIALVVLRDPKMLAIRRAILINVGIFMVLNIVYGATTPGVDNFAHIGGFLTGLLCGGVLYILDRNEKQPVPAV